MVEDLDEEGKKAKVPRVQKKKRVPSKAPKQLVEAVEAGEAPTKPKEVKAIVVTRALTAALDDVCR